MRVIRHPVLGLTPTKRALLFVAALVFGFVLWYALRSLDAPLVRPQSQWGIVSLQLARTPERSQEILAAWDKSARDNAQSGLLLDFLFPVCYSTALTVVCFWAATLFRDRGYRKTGWLAASIAWLQWPAALFDYVENIALWVELRGTVADPWPAIAFYCASIKFLLIAAAFCILVAALVIWIFRLRALLGHPHRREPAAQLGVADRGAHRNPFQPGDAREPGQLVEQFRFSRLFGLVGPRLPAHLARQFPCLFDVIVRHAQRNDFKAGEQNSLTGKIVGNPAGTDRQDQGSLAILWQPGFKLFEPAQHDESDHEGRNAEPELSAAEAEAHHGDKPERGRRRHAQHPILLPQDGPRADKTDARQNTQRKPHQVEHDKRIARLTHGVHQQVRLNHRDRGRQADEHRRSQTGRATVLRPVKADQSASDDGQDEPKRDFVPLHGGRHGDQPLRRARALVTRSAAGHRSKTNAAVAAIAAPRRRLRGS